MTDVLYLMGGLGLGGTERHLSLVLPQLARRGWRLEVALLTEIGCFGEPLAAAGVPVRALGKPRVPPIPKLRGLLQLRGQAQLLAERLRLLHPRILHCFLPTCCIVGSWAARAAGYKSVAMSRRSQASRPSLFLGDKWLELRALSTANIVLGHSHWVMRELENEGVAPECLRLVHNGIALTPRRLDNQERNAIRATEGWLEDEPIIVSVANLIPYKGHVELLKALGQVAAAGMRRWRLVLIGDGAPNMSRHFTRSPPTFKSWTASNLPEFVMILDDCSQERTLVF
ncbi:MAG: glycosyltransferase [Hyphomicrobium sp.]|nr:glycosyltransferase [Hyphomicrobium sp.]